MLDDEEALDAWTLEYYRWLSSLGGRDPAAILALVPRHLRRRWAAEVDRVNRLWSLTAVSRMPWGQRPIHAEIEQRPEPPA